MKKKALLMYKICYKTKNLAKYEIIKENIMKSDQRWNLLKRNSYKEASHIMSLKISRDNNYAVSTNYKGALTMY